MAFPGKTDIAVEFLPLCASGEVREAYDRHVAENFRHHNASFPGDRDSLLTAMERSAQSEPSKSFTVRQTLESADRVAVLSHLRREHPIWNTPWSTSFVSKTGRLPRCGTWASKSRGTPRTSLACSSLGDRASPRARNRDMA